MPPQLPDISAGPGAIRITRSGPATDVSAPSMRVEDLLRETIDPTDVLTQMDAVRLAIELDTGTKLPDLRPAHTRDGDEPFHVLPPRQGSEGFDEPPHPEPEPEPEYAGTYTFPQPSGDLTGDGLEDILAWDVSLPEGEIEVRALRGTDGRELWRLTIHEIADAVWMDVPDVTGDAISDILLVGLSVHSEEEQVDCPESGDHCRYDYSAEYTWMRGILSGADGTVVWTREVPGEHAYHFSVESQGDTVTDRFAVEESLEGTNISVFPFLYGDHDDDGREDMVLESIDLDFDIEYTSERTVILYEDSGAFDIESQTRAEVLSGADGDLLYSHTSEPGPAIAEIWPGGDLVGDAATDFLWKEFIFTPDTFECIWIVGIEQCSDPPDDSMRFGFQAIDGSTFESAWRTEVSGVWDAYGYPVGGDVTGDGRDDIAVFTVTLGEGLTFDLRLLSGNNGSTLWTRQQTSDAFSPEFPMAVDSYGGGPGDDLLVGSFLDGTAGDIRLSRVDGASGQTIFETEPRLYEPAGSPDFSYTVTYLFRPTDLDREAGPDVLATGITFAVDCDDLTGECGEPQLGSSTLAESGRTGSVFHRSTRTGGISFAYPVGDLSGDGISDVFSLEEPLEEDGEYAIVASRLDPTVEMWRRTLSWDEYWNGTFWVSGDHDGGPGVDIVYGSNTLNDATWTAVVASVKGSNGVERWRVERT